MGRWRSKEERLNLGARALYLREEEKLEWKDVAERLELSSETQAIIYYRKYKEAKEEGPGKLKTGEMKSFAKRHGIEVGYVWLYENGFKKRVPPETQKKIEDGKLGIGGRPKTKMRFNKRFHPKKSHSSCDESTIE